MVTINKETDSALKSMRTMIKPICFLSEVGHSARAPPGVHVEAQQQRSGDLLLTEKQTPETEQPAAAEGPEQ